MTNRERPVYPDQVDRQEFKDRFYSNKDITKKNRDSIKTFINRMEGLNVGTQRVRKILSNLKTLLTKIEPDLDLKTASQKDLTALSKKIKDSEYSESYKEDFHNILRKYYRVMEGGNTRYPKKLDYFKYTSKRKNRKTPSDVISRDEFHQLLSQCINSRDKAILWILYEGGLRCGELCQLDCKDVKLVEDGVDLHVPDKKGCKTGSRDIWLTECYMAVKEWINSHPVHEPDNPLFVTLEKHRRKEKNVRLDGYTIRAMIKRKASLAFHEKEHRTLKSRKTSKKEKSRLQKTINQGIRKYHPHGFRHSCATEKAILGFSESQLNQFMGWRQGSKMAGVYIHMSGDRLKEAYKKALGIPVNGERKYKPCPRCGYESNSFLAGKCGRCDTPLDAKKRMELENKKDKALNFFNHLMNKYPKLNNEIEKYAKIEAGDLNI